MVARKHHYVPQCYLKGFVQNRDNPKLYVTNIDDGRTFETAPANVAAERDFHSIDIEGLSKDAFENALSGFESELSPSLSRIIASRSLKNKHDRSFLLNLIGLMLVKNPDARSRTRDFEESIAKSVLEIATSNPRIFESQINAAKKKGFIDPDAEVDYQTARDHVVNDKIKIEIPTERLLLRELGVFDRILPYLFHRKWVLLKASKEETGFVTSDHPVCLQWTNPEDRRGLYPPGLGLRDTQVLFPVSNELALIGAFECREAEIEADSFQIAAFNNRIIARSERQFYARNKDFLQIRLGENPFQGGVFSKK